MLKNCFISSHHGTIKCVNKLLPTLELLSQHPEIDMVEIDFVYNGKYYISAHDYNTNTIACGSTLHMWVDAMLLHQKILWIDLKDDNTSILVQHASKLNIDVLLSELWKLDSIYNNFKKHVIISCQYHNIYDQLVNYSPCLVIKDCPMDKMYVLEAVLPKSIIYSNYIQTYIQECMYVYIKDSEIIAIDVDFFENRHILETFIRRLKVGTSIILYNYDIGDQIISVDGYHIIMQYNYF